VRAGTKAACAGGLRFAACFRLGAGRFAGATRFDGRFRVAGRAVFTACLRCGRVVLVALDVVCWTVGTVRCAVLAGAAPPTGRASS
jgi:hypothetical protein